MSETETTIAAFVRAATDHALLNLPIERLPGLTDAAASVHELLRSVAGVDLGETAPATSFDPSWD